MRRRGRLVLAAGVAATLLTIALILLYRAEVTGPTDDWMASEGLTPRSEVIEGLRVRYVRVGRGPAVLLLHGFASSIVTWRGVIPPLARDHDVIALDLPGFGGSDQPARLDHERYLKVLVGLLDRLGVPRASLIGNSLGGAVAVTLAARAPERVERLALLDSAGFNLRARDRPWVLRLGEPRLAATLLERLPVRRLLVTVALRQIFFDRSLVTPERIDEYLAPLLRPGAVASMRSLLVRTQVSPEAFAAEAGRVRAPTLVLWGRQDAWIPVSDAERFAAAIAGARVQVLDACGHMPQEERPREVAALLAEFLAGPVVAQSSPSAASDGRGGDLMAVRSREEAALVLADYHDRLDKAARAGQPAFDEAFENPPADVGVHEIDEQHAIVRVSSAELRLLGYAREQMLGHKAWEFIVMQEASQRAIDQKLKEGTELRPFVRSFRRGDGSALPLLLLDRQIRDGSGRIVGLRTAMAPVLRSTATAEKE
jgi:PAS domain S-box-containing protein